MATNNAVNVGLSGATGTGSFVGSTSASLTTPNIGVASGTSFNSLTSAASQADQETATSTTTVVTPGRQQFHPSSPKAWLIYNLTGSAVIGSYNISGVVKNATGQLTASFTTAFSGATYGASMSCNDVSLIVGRGTTYAVGSMQVNVANSVTGVLTDAAWVSVVWYGDQ